MAAGLIDEARVSVRAGDGGDGSASFHREKYRPKGGPDGGDGGRGGSVILTADLSVDTLSEFRVRRLLRAGSGARGSGNHKRGKDGADVHVKVPVGTVVRDYQTGEVLADLASSGASHAVARGGRGGRGNSSIASSRDRAPNFAERGEPGEEADLLLDMRIVADVGLLGPPNAGKSTLLAALSAARPKVADYPFTTLQPHLGVVDTAASRVVVADLPGLVEGAHSGRGLGTRFLRHAERCALLCLMVDLASPTLAEDLETVYAEVEAYEPELAARVRMVVGNKRDLPNARPEVVTEWASRREVEVVTISAMFGDGTPALAERMAAAVSAARAERPAAESFAVFRPVAEDKLLVERERTGWRVRSERVERLVSMTPLSNPRAVRYLQRRLNALGVDATLGRHGAVEGDEVYISDHTFEYHPEPPEGRR